MKKKLTALILAALLLLSLCGCEQEDVQQQSSNFANTVMTGDVFAYRDGFIYFADAGYMYEYDTESGKTARLKELKCHFAYHITPTDENICYIEMNGQDLQYITRDGKNSGTLFQRNGLMHNLFLDGNTWYFESSRYNEDRTESIEQLWSRDAETGEETLLYEAEIINPYFVTDEYIYVVWVDITGYSDKGEALLDGGVVRSAKDKIAFEPVETACIPGNLFVDGEDLYILQAGTWQIWHWANGVETALPVVSPYYQVFDGHLIYNAGKPGAMGECGDPLVIHNLETGEEKLLAGSAFYFAILGERYIAYAVTPDGSVFRWYVYDWQTGETKEMVKPV